MDDELRGEILRVAVRSRRSKGRPTPSVQWFVAVLMAISFALSLISAVLTRVPVVFDYVTRQSLVDFAFLSVFVSQLFAFIHNIIVILYGIPAIFRPINLIVDPILDDILLDVRDVERLVKFRKRDLKHAIERIDLGIKHVRSRLSILCGAIDKIGVIPAIVTWSIAYFNYRDKVSSDVLYMAGMAISLSFIMGIFGEIALHKVERMLCVLKVALSYVEDSEKFKGDIPRLSQERENTILSCMRHVSSNILGSSVLYICKRLGLLS